VAAATAGLVWKAPEAVPSGERRLPGVRLHGQICPYVPFPEECGYREVQGRRSS
jgi:hypothetical protein